MKEIERLKSFSTNLLLFRKEYEFKDIRVKKEYGDAHFDELVQELNWGVEEIPKLKFWFCLEFFKKSIDVSVEKIMSKVYDNMDQPFSTTHKSEFLKSLITDFITLYYNFSSLGNKFGRAENVSDGSFENSLLGKIPMINLTSLYSANDFVNDIFNYTLKISKIDFTDFINHLRRLSIGNVLAFACDLVALDMLYLICELIKDYPKFLAEKDVLRIIKKLDKGIVENTVVLRGRPKKTEKNETLKELWKSENRSFESAMDMLIQPRTIFDNRYGFVINDNDKLKWVPEPSGCHVKYIQGFLLFCQNKGFLDLKGYSSRDLQNIFIRTFHLNVNNKSMIFKNILAVEDMYIRQFW